MHFWGKSLIKEEERLFFGGRYIKQQLACNLHKESMNIAIAIFKDCVSPRLDNTDKLVVYQLENEQFINRKYLYLIDAERNQLLPFLQSEQISMVICGSCPQSLYRMLCCRGISVVPVVESEIDTVEKLLIEGNLNHISICNPGRRCIGKEKSKCERRKESYFPLVRENSREFELK